MTSNTDEYDYEYPEDTDEEYDYDYPEPEAQAPQEEESFLKKAGKKIVKALTPNVEFAEQYIGAKKQMHEKNLPEFTKGLARGVTAGFTDRVEIDGEKILKPSEDSVFGAAGEVVGSFIPLGLIHKVFGLGAANIAQKSAVYGKQLKSLGNLIAVPFATGAAWTAAEQIAQPDKELNAKEIAAHGLGWVGLDMLLNTLGASGRFVKHVIKKADKTGKPKTEIVNRLIKDLSDQGIDISDIDKIDKTALRIIEREMEMAEGTLKLPEKKLTPIEEVGNKNIKAAEKELQIQQRKKELAERKIEVVPTEHQTKLEVPEPYKPNQFTAEELIEESSSAALEKDLDNVSPRAKSNQEFGKSVKESVESSIKESKQEYEPAYELVDESIDGLSVTPQKSAGITTEMLKKIESLATKATGSQKVMSVLESTLQDVGFKIVRDEAGNITQAIQEESIPMSKLMELGRRLNQIVKYDYVEKNVQDQLRKVVAAVKEDIRVGLKSRPEALELWEEAEAKFAKSAKRFNKDSIKNIRKMDKTEQVAQVIKSPSVLEDLKEVLPEKEYKLVEREVLEQMNSMTEQRAEQFYREVSPHLSAESNGVAMDILESKAAKTLSREQRLFNKTRDKLFDEFTEMTLTGEKPTYSLKLWKTEDGQKFIKQALKDSPNKEEILNYLEQQSLKDLSESVAKKDGSADLKKLKEFMKDPAARENVRLIGGEDAVKFLEQAEALEEKSQKFTELVIENLPKDKKEKASKYLINKAKEWLNKPPKSVEIFKKTHPKKSGEKIGDGKIERGRQILERIARSDQPLTAKMNDWIELIETFRKESGFKGTGYIGKIPFKGIKYIINNPQIRNAWKEAKRSKNDLTPYIRFYELLIEHMFF